MAWRKWLRESGGPLLLITLLGAPLLTPLLRWTAVSCTHDGHLHYHRVAAMRYAWQQGLAFTRWLPDLAFGYGYPFFVYREPTPLYAVLFPHLMGMPLPAATNLFYALCILACGWFMFLWVRDLLGTRAGIVSAVAYMSAPYVMVDALIRGNSPESLALPLFPLILWAGRRWLLDGTRRFFLLAVLSLAFLSLSHNISTLIFTPTLLVYLLALAWFHRLPIKTALLRGGLLFILGLGMTIFYTGGALLEIDQVTLEQSTITRNNDFRFNFTTPGEILAPVQPEDPLLLNPPLPFRLGWALAGLATVGVGWAIVNCQLSTGKCQLGREQRLHVWLMVAGTAVYLFMSLPISQFVWETVPLIDFAQFPWRFVGRAALPLAFLVGLPFTRSPLATRHSPPTIYHLLLLLAITLLILESIPNLYPNICQEEGFPTINAVHQYERDTGLVGVDPEGSYFPRTVAKRPKSSPLEANYVNGNTPQRFDTASLPTDAKIDQISYHNRGATLQLTTAKPFTARYLSFDFPGWQVRIDDTAVPITPSDPEGLITFPVPAGTHQIDIRWQSTPLRTALVALSIVALLGVPLVLRFSPSTGSSQSSPEHNVFSTRHIQTLVLLGVGLLAFKLLIADRVDTPLRRTAAPEVANSLILQGGEMQMAGFTTSADAVKSGETFDVDMAWTAVSPPSRSYQTNVWLVGSDGLTWSDLETFRPRLYEDLPPTQFWLPTQWGWDSREVRVLHGTPPGDYTLMMTLFDQETLAPITLTDENGTVVGPTATLGTMTVLPSDQPPEFTPQAVVNTAVPQTNAQLIGYSQDRNAAQPGELLLLTLFWERLTDIPSGTVTVMLRDESGQPAANWKMDLWSDDVWQVGDRLRNQLLLRLPADLHSGTHTFYLSETVVLGDVAITAPDRVFEQPEVETAVGRTFSNPDSPVATLTGFTHTIQNESIQLTLVWQANSETSTSYRIFVHLLDNQGNIIAQSDGEPANWHRPTTGWVTSEYIIDPHTLTRPTSPEDEPLTLNIGLYDPITGTRLLSDSGDAVRVTIAEEE